MRGRVWTAKNHKSKIVERVDKITQEKKYDVKIMKSKIWIPYEIGLTSEQVLMKYNLKIDDVKIKEKTYITN